MRERLTHAVLAAAVPVAAVLATGVTAVVFPTADVLAATPQQAAPAPASRTAPQPNTLSDEERAAGWRLLFDGRTTRGWHALALPEISSDYWQVKDGLLLSLAPTGPHVPNADIVSDGSYSSFELRAEFRLSRGANSGIKYFLRPDVRADGGLSSVGYEYQLIDDDAPDASAGVNKARSLASLYDVFPAAATKPTRPLGAWNEARIVVRGRHVEHWLNGVEVLQFERGSQEFRERVARSKHSVWPGYGDETAGPILLQHHGGGVAFRNVALRPLEVPDSASPRHGP